MKDEVLKILYRAVRFYANPSNWRDTGGVFNSQAYKQQHYFAKRALELVDELWLKKKEKE